MDGGPPGDATPDEGELLGRLLEAAPEYAVFALEADGRVRTWPRGAERLLGYSAAEIVGRPVGALLTAEDAAAGPSRRDLDEVLATGRVEIDRWLVRRDGVRIWAAGLLTAIRGPDGTLRGVGCLLRDRTDWKRADLARQAGEATRAAVFETSLDALITIDRRGHVVEFNPAAERIFGYRREEALGRPMADLIVPPALRDAHRRGFDRALATGEGRILGRRLELTARRSDGTEFPAELVVTRVPAGPDVYFTGTIRDVTDRRRSEASLRESEQRLRTLIDNIPAGAVYRAVAEPGGARRFVFLSAGIERIFGVAAAEGVADAALLYGAIHEGDRGRMRAEEERALATGTTFDCEFRVHHRGGAVRWVHGRSAPHVVAEGHVVWEGVLFDITDRKLAEQRLRDSEERFRGLFEAMDEGFCVAEILLDDRGRPDDYRIVEMNPAFRHHTGLGDVAGQTTRQFAPDLERHWVETYGRVALTGTPARFVNESKALGGRWFDVSAFRLGGPESLRIAILFNDITARRQAEAERDRLTEQRQVALDAARLGWWHYDPVAGVSTYDGRYREIFGVAGSSRPVEETLAFLHPEDRPRVWASVEAALDVADPQPFSVEYRIHRPDGALRWIEAHGLATFEGAGPGRRAVSLVGTVADVTDRKRVEAERERLLREVETERARLADIAARLSEADRRKDEFLATLAHELRNPLAPIRTGLEVLRLTGYGARDAADVCRTMERQTQQLVRLVDDLMDVSRITRGRLELRVRRIDLEGAVASAVESVRPLLDEAGHALTVTLPEGSTSLDADPVRLAQVLSNLLVNAAKYTPPGGRIALVGARDGAWLDLAVTDTGVGIPPEMRERIFEMFTQVDRSSERGAGGLGIGLTLVRSIVELHGGSVTVESPGPGRGSTFRLRLPLSSPVRAEAPAPASPPADAPTERLRVLVVDDNQAAANLLGVVVKLLGHDVQIAHDGRQAIAAAAKVRPQVVLMDIGMPEMNGYEAARHIRGQPWGEGVTLVALTGWGQTEDRRRTQEAGFDRHLTKPAEPSVIRQILAEASAASAEAGR